MQQDVVLSAPALHLGFMAVCVVLLITFYTVPWFDLRSLKRLVKRRIGKQASDEEKTRGQDGLVADMFDRPDLGAILNLLVILGTGLAMLIGWRIPAEIERIYGSGASFGLLFPTVEMTTLGKAAQVVGATCLGLIALRLLRLLVVFAAAGMAGVTSVAAMNYVFDLNLFSLF